MFDAVKLTQAYKRHKTPNGAKPVKLAKQCWRCFLNGTITCIALTSTATLPALSVLSQTPYTNKAAKLFFFNWLARCFPSVGVFYSFS